MISRAFNSAKIKSQLNNSHMVLTLDDHKIFSQLIQCFIRDAPLTFGPPLAHYISSSLALFSFWWKMRVNDKRDSIFTLGSKMHFMSPLALWVSFSLLIFQSHGTIHTLRQQKRTWWMGLGNDQLYWLSVLYLCWHSAGTTIFRWT